MTRIEQLKKIIDDGAATEADVFEYRELKEAVECKAPPQTVEEWKAKHIADWIDSNMDTLLKSWAEYLSEMEDSPESIRYVANSDKCFHEWCEKQYDGDPTE